MPHFPHTLSPFSASLTLCLTVWPLLWPLSNILLSLNLGGSWNYYIGITPSCTTIYVQNNSAFWPRPLQIPILISDFCPSSPTGPTLCPTIQRLFCSSDPNFDDSWIHYWNFPRPIDYTWVLDTSDLCSPTSDLLHLPPMTLTHRLLSLPCSPPAPCAGLLLRSLEPPPTLSPTPLMRTPFLYHITDLKGLRVWP